MGAGVLPLSLDDPGAKVTCSSRALVTADKGNDPPQSGRGLSQAWVRNRSSTGWPRIDLTERRQERWISRTSRSSSAPGVGKSEHWATTLSQEGRKVLDRALPNDEERLRALYKKLADHGHLLVVVDQPATIGALAVAVAQDMGITVGYLPGLSMRRIADLTPGRVGSGGVCTVDDVVEFLSWGLSVQDDAGSAGLGCVVFLGLGEYFFP